MDKLMQEPSYLEQAELAERERKERLGIEESTPKGKLQHLDIGMFVGYK